MKYFNRVLAFFLAVLLIISYMPGSISALEDDNNTTANSAEEYSEDASESMSDTLEDNSEGLDSSANEYDVSTLTQNSEENPLDSNAASLDESVEEENPQSDKVGIEEPENRSSEDTLDGSEADLSGDSNELSLLETDSPEETNDNESSIIASGTDDLISWTLDSEGVLTIAGNGSMPNYQYSSSPWSEYIESIKSVIITDGVTNIGSGAFKKCSNLISIEIPDTVTSIKGSAFSNCSSLTSIVIPDGVTSIEGSTFSNCSSLTSIDIPESVTSIGYAQTFYGCSSLTSIVIPEGVTSIGLETFSGCSSLVNVVIPNTVTNIEGSAFNGCRSLESIEIPNSVTSIGYNAFSGCSSLTSIVIPEGVTSIEDSTFNYCTSLTSIKIPEGVTSIGDSAFYNCISLTSIDIPDGVTSIGDNAFYNCSGLTSVIIPNSVTSIGDRAFYYCPADMEVSNSITSIGLSAFQGCKGLKSIILADGTTSIEDGAFQVSGLTSIVIPDGVTSIGDNAFSNCTNLKDIVIPKSVTSIGDNAFNYCIELKSVILSEGITSIGSATFSRCISLTSIVIPESVTSIGLETFSGCSSLASITIPESVTSIGDSAFEDCSSLTSIVIPKSVTSIGRYAFSDCGLKDIYYTGSAEEWKQIIIEEYNDRLIDATKYFTIDSGACGDNLTWTLYTEGLFVLDGNGAMPDYGNRGTPWYDYRDQITKVVISEGITTVGSGAFFSSSNLSSVVISKGVTRINENAFIMCHNLTSITLPVELTKIEDFAFNLCDSLTEISYPGTYDDWSRISIGENNGPLEKAAIDYFTIGKTFSAPEYEWEYNSGNYFLTGRIACIEIPDIVIKEYASVDSEIEKESTCTEEGIIKYIASFEDPRFETQERTETTPALGHDLEHFDAVEATTEEDGNIEYWYCAACEKYFSDEDASNEIDLSDTIIPQLPETQFHGKDIKAFLVLDEVYHNHKEDNLDDCDVFVFTAPEEGTYRFHTVDMTDQMDADISIYKKATSVDPFVEDIDENVPGFDVCCKLEAGQNVYLQISMWTKIDEEWDYGTDASFVVELVKNEILALEPNTTVQIDATYDHYEVFEIVAESNQPYHFFVLNNGIMCENIKVALSDDSDPTKMFSDYDSIDYWPSIVMREGQRVYVGIEVINSNFDTDTDNLVLYAYDEDYLEANCPHGFWDEWSYGAPGCETKGHRAYTQCILCGKCFADATAKKELDYETEILIPAAGHNWGPWTVEKKATTSAAGQEKRVCLNDPTHIETRSIAKLISIKKATVSGIKASYVYTAKEIKPTVKVVLSGKALKNGTDYKVTYSKNKSVGTATVKITGIGKYADSISKTFKINPKGTTLATSTAASKAITVKWKKQSAKMASSRITGYQIQLATNSKFTKNKKTVTVSGYSKTSKKVTKLKGKTKYYIRIRTYKTISGKKYYSPWSKAKTVTTKK